MRAKGSDIRCNEVVIKTGTTIGHLEVALLASLGISTVRVHKHPVVAVISYGEKVYFLIVLKIGLIDRIEHLATVDRDLGTPLDSVCKFLVHAGPQPLLTSWPQWEINVFLTASEFLRAQHAWPRPVFCFGINKHK